MAQAIVDIKDIQTETVMLSVELTPQEARDFNTYLLEGPFWDDSVGGAIAEVIVKALEGKGLYHA